MKHLHITSWAIGLLAVSLLTGCSKEQSELSIENIPGRATIVGSLSYSQGQAYSSGQFSELLSPASGVKVSIMISNASLAPNGSAQGYTVCETTTDVNGKYSIEIPAVNNTQIIIKPASFIGNRTLVTGWEENKPIMETEEVVFSLNNIQETVSPGDIVVKDEMYSYTPRTFTEGFGEVAKIKGKIGIGKLYHDNNQRYWDTKSGINVLLTVTYNYTESEENTPTNMERMFGATTNANGEFVALIPVKEKGEKLRSLQVTPVSFYENSFKHFDYTGDPEYLAGTYDAGGAYSGYYNNYTFPVIDNIENPVCATMIFTENKEGGYDESSAWSRVDTWGTQSFE